jgi:hypothetical protein
MKLSSRSQRLEIEDGAALANDAQPSASDP